MKTEPEIKGELGDDEDIAVAIMDLTAVEKVTSIKWHTTVEAFESTPGALLDLKSKYATLRKYE